MLPDRMFSGHERGSGTFVPAAMSYFSIADRAADGGIIARGTLSFLRSDNDADRVQRYSLPGFGVTLIGDAAHINILAGDADLFQAS
jgi:hypothetical protein